MRITHKAKFLKLVKEDCIIPSLKSYSDTLLFYYIGHMAATNNFGNLFEIGVGGSTYPLLELSLNFKRKFVIVDSLKEQLDRHSSQEFFSESIIEKHYISSTNLDKTNITDLLYCHVDGNKNYNITTNDLKFCIKHLVKNGIICQDDYGNNKWPTVTDAVKDLIQAGELVMLLVGDSSCWLTKPEYYDYWMTLFATDSEFIALKPFVNIRQSKQLNRLPNYLFLQSLIDGQYDYIADSDTLNYYDSLLDLNSNGYLGMPYRTQSTLGINFRKKIIPLLSLSWDTLRGDDWPEAPVTRNDIDQLPDWVKNELKTLHKIEDLYAETTIISDYCVRDKHMKEKL